MKQTCLSISIAPETNDNPMRLLVLNKKGDSFKIVLRNSGYVQCFWHRPRYVIIVQTGFVNLPKATYQLKLNRHNIWHNLPLCLCDTLLCASETGSDSSASTVLWLFLLSLLTAVAFLTMVESLSLLVEPEEFDAPPRYSDLLGGILPLKYLIWLPYITTTWFNMHY